MYGAILGDIVGSPFEFDRGSKSKEFTMFGRGAHFTDDTVMTVAVAEALLDAGRDADPDTIRRYVTEAMRRWGRRYPYAGYGGRFRHWLYAADPHPYGSYGNGSAMRVSAAGWLYDTLERTREVARATADVTHDHPEGIKGAEAVASVIFLARHGSDKAQIRDYVLREFRYDLSRSIDEIRPRYHHVESCQETVPEAITAFLEGQDFEDVVRTAVSLGGDCDTLTDIAAAMAEAMYGIPAILQSEVEKRLEPEMLAVVKRFDKALGRTAERNEGDDPLAGNEIIEEACRRFSQEETKETLLRALFALHTRLLDGGHFLVPAQMKTDMRKFIDVNKVRRGDVITNDEPIVFKQCSVEGKDGRRWLVAFTSMAEYEKGESAEVILNQPMGAVLGAAAQSDDFDGLALNPWGDGLLLTKELIGIVCKDRGEGKE